MTDPKHPNAYPWLEQLSSEELESLLQQDFVSGESRSDTDLVMAVLDTLDQREAQPANLDAAWETFRTRCLRSQETAPEPPSDPPAPSPAAAAPASTTVVPASAPAASFLSSQRHPALRRVITVAAAVCVLMCLMTLPAYASGKLQDHIRWTDETFYFLPEHPSAVVNTQEYLYWEQKMRALTDRSVLPTWYPEGSTITRIEETPPLDDFGSKVSVIFQAGDREFLIHNLVYASQEILDLNTPEYEKNPGSPEEYFSHGIPHYIMGNMERNVAVWRNGLTENLISGYLSVDELKKMIDSIYE